MPSVFSKASATIEFILVRGLVFILRRLSYRRISDLGSLAGTLFKRLGIRKRVALQNILQSDLGVRADQAEAIVSGSYSHFGRTFFELLALDRISLTEGKDFEWIYPDGFYESIAHGAIFISAHIGNWELMGKILSAKRVPLAVVVKRQYNESVDRLILRIREKVGMKVLYDDEPLKLRRLIEERNCIALLADQDFGDNGVPVHFLGRECFAQEGPVFLARKFNLPVFFCFALRREDYFHHFEIQPLKMDLSKNNPALVQQYTDEIGKLVKAYPSQWLWHHRRWKVHA